MTLRRKLTFNLLFLFAVILLLAVVGSYYLSLLASVSTEVTTDNYRTLSYVQEMNNVLARLDYTLARPSAIVPEGEGLRERFDTLQLWLVRQEGNITEPGERELTANLRTKIVELRSLVLAEKFQDSAASTSWEAAHTILLDIHRLLERIHRINSQAVLQKNRTATETAKDAILSTSIFGTVGIIIGWLFVITLPGVIFKPINEFNNALGEITAGNYDITLPTSGENEFGKLAGTFNRMTAKLKEYEQTNFASVLQQKQRLDTIINRMSEGVIGIGANRRIIFANDIALQLLELDEKEVAGRYAPDLAINNMLFAEILGRADVKAGGEETVQAGYLKIVLNNRERMYAQTVFSLPAESFGDDTDATERIIMLSDITEFAAKDSAKTKLIATLSHELKTPTAVIDMCADLMQAPQVGILNSEQKDYLETIRGNTLRIRRLIADMTDLTKAESGVIDMRMEAVKPALLIDRAVEGVRILLQDKRIKTQINLDENLPAVTADVNKAVWALNNLLTNAIRYSPPESTITIQGTRATREILISVIDQGKGLPADAGERLFDRYTRFGDDTEGTGLGLAIVKEFVEAMGGSVDAESTVGGGSRFRLAFKIAEPNASEDQVLS